MECVFETVTIDDEKHLRSKCSLDSVSPPACDALSRSLLLKVECSNLEPVTNWNFVKKLIQSIPFLEGENRFQLPVGNCVKGNVLAVGDRVESFKGSCVDI